MLCARRSAVCSRNQVFRIFVRCLVSDLLCLELEACTKANEELQKLRDAAEVREAATEEKLRLEREARKGMIRKSYAMFLFVMFFGLG